MLPDKPGPIFQDRATGERTWMSVEMLRYSSVATSAAMLADLIGLDERDVHQQLREWAEGPGLPYGIGVADDGTINVVPDESERP